MVTEVGFQPVLCSARHCALAADPAKPLLLIELLHELGLGLIELDDVLVGIWVASEVGPCRLQHLGVHRGQEVRLARPLGGQPRAHAGTAVHGGHAT